MPRKKKCVFRKNKSVRRDLNDDEKVLRRRSKRVEKLSLKKKMEKQKKKVISVNTKRFLKKKDRNNRYSF